MFSSKSVAKGLGDEFVTKVVQISGNFSVIRTKRSERAKRAHSVLREVEKMGYKNFFAHTRIG